MNKLIVFILIATSLTLISKETSKSDNTLNDITSYETNITVEEPIFTAQEIPDNIYKKMLGNSIPFEYTEKINRSSLSYLKISYIGFDSKSHTGEMIVSSKLSNEVLDIFKELYILQYPIEKIRLIDEYNANDELSMSDNNTSCFCYRVVNGSSKLSNHALGTAIDINPLYNPYVKNNFISPVSSTIYANRSSDFNYKISKNDVLYNVFKSKNWSWGGDWKSPKDYQHFEKNI